MPRPIIDAMKTGDYGKLTKIEYAVMAVLLLIGMLHGGIVLRRAAHVPSMPEVHKHAAPAPALQYTLYGADLAQKTRTVLQAMDSIESSQELSAAGFQLSEDSARAIASRLDALRERGYSATFLLADWQTGRVLAYKPLSPRYSASAIKGPVVLADAAHELLNAPDDADLAAQTITISDNDAYAELVQRYGLAALADWTTNTRTSVNMDAEVGIGTAKYMWLSAADLTKMWLLGYDFLFGSADRSGEWFVQPFGSSSNSFIRDALGSDATVYSKAGWIHDDEYFTAQNDAGIVRTSSGDFVLTVLSDAYGENELLAGLVRTLAEVRAADMLGA
ncbi:serine hydrolase [Alloscardovia macacae]|nr:serine hydrolase [Alloscardovia macacae]